MSDGISYHLKELVSASHGIKPSAREQHVLDNEIVLMVGPKLFSNLGAKANLELWSVSEPRL